MLPPVKKVNEHRLSREITVPEIRLVGDNVEPVVMNTLAAIAMAEEQGLDLVEISPKAVPPVCKIMDYKKFLYEKKRKEKELKAKAHNLIQMIMI